MADEDTQSREESLWWAFDASSDSPLPTATFDEPLEWPDALPWEEFDAGPPSGDAFPDPDHLNFDLLFPPASAATAVEVERPSPVAQLGGAVNGDGGDGGDGTQLQIEPLPDSIWAAEPASGNDQPPRLVTLTGTISADDGAPPLYAEAEHASGRGRRPRWLAVPRGNAAVVALIAFASLVLLGMFLSVRARNDLPTDTSRTPVTQADIAATRPLNTVPLNTSPTLPPSTIALSDLVPPADAAAAGTGSSGGGTTSGTSAPATTAPRSSSPAGSTATTAPQPTTATTAAPVPPDTTTATTTPASSSDNDTTQTTRRTTTTVDIPRPSYTIPDITWPSTVTTRPRPGDN